MSRRILIATCLVLALHRASLGAQIVFPPAEDAVGPPAPVVPSLSSAARTMPVFAASQPGEGRACDGCPPRRIGKAFLQATVINGFYELANLIRGQETAKITPKTWWANMEQGWVWDLDDFLVNQVGHPYQGSNYYNAGRANGLSFYESAAVTAFGSATWEFYGETNHASLNDLINTTLGGIALGEMFHRAGWLIRDTRKSGRGRLWSEIGATVLDPVTGVNRFLSGDSSRVSDKPAEFVPTGLGGFASAGVLWRGSQTTRAVEAQGDPFLEMDVLYGNPGVGRSRTPYDAFSVRLRFGGGSAFSEARVRGRLLGQPLGSGAVQFNVVQSYDFQSNNAYSIGAQSFDAMFGTTKALSSRNRLTVAGWGGVTILGAVDSLPVDLEERPDEEIDPDAPQGVSEGPRYYDYGPGTDFGGLAALTRDDRPLATLSYEGRHLFSLDGVRANHFLQRTRLDLFLPLRGPLGLGVSGEYLVRDTYYQDDARTHKGFRYPQLRGYFTWNVSDHQAPRGNAQPPARQVPGPSVAAAASASEATGAGASRLWLAAGTGFTALRGDCQTCEEDFPYRKAGNIFGNAGYRVSPRMNAGAQVFWVSTDTADGHVRTTHVDAVAQFRPWGSSGFFVEGGAGMAFVRNWVDATGPDASNQKALSVVVGAGWIFRPEARVGLQVFGMQHAGAIGDLKTADTDIQDVMANFWTVGAAIVIR